MPNDEAEYLSASCAGRGFWGAALIRCGVHIKQTLSEFPPCFNQLDLMFEAVASFKICHIGPHTQ